MCDLRGFEPRNTEPVEERKVEIIKPSPIVEKQFTGRIQEPKVLGTILLRENKKSEIRTNSKRQTGKVIDLQKPAVVTRWVLWGEYRQKYPDGYSYSRFCDYYAQWRQSRSATMHVEHEPGDKLFIDFTGKKRECKLKCVR